MEDSTYVPYDDLDDVARRIDNETAAIMVEPIQGRGASTSRPPNTSRDSDAWPTSTVCC